MSFLERKETLWSWSEEDQTLTLDDKALLSALLQLFIGLGSFQILFILYDEGWNWISVVITILLYVPITGGIIIAFYTTSLKSIISIEEIDSVVLKGTDKTRINIKLKKGRYRQLYFVAGFQYMKFMEFEHSQNIEIKERSLYWSMPINY
jgi:hypothetical protein